MHPEQEAIGICGRCATGFCEIDRRIQPRGPDLCQRCHLDPRSRALPIEVPESRANETRASGWWARSGRTLAALLVHPNACFRAFPEPVDHGLVLKFLATVRLPLWVALLLALAVRHGLRDTPEPMRIVAIHAFLEPALVQALSVWSLLLVPVGIPLVYFLAGLLAHASLDLAGGAPRSIGATMRAVGYAIAPGLMLISVLDLVVYLFYPSGMMYFVGVTLIATLLVPRLALALASTHGVHVVRGVFAAMLPLALVCTSMVARHVLDLEDLLFLSTFPQDRYVIP